MLKGSHTILVVDDEPITLKMLASLFQTRYRVLTAPSGNAALEVLKTERVSMVISDQRMPGMTGTELLRQVRDIDPDVPCVLMSAVDDTGVFIDAITKSGAIRVITKPWDAVKLCRDVELSLERFEMAVESKRSIDGLRQARESLNRFAGGNV